MSRRGNRCGVDVNGCKYITCYGKGQGLSTAAIFCTPRPQPGVAGSKLGEYRGWIEVKF